MDKTSRIYSPIASLDREAMAQARRRQAILTKPAGSLGRLEELSVQLAGIFGRAAPAVSRKVIVVAAADHGVVEEGVSAYPQDVTGQMVLNFLRGGAAINVLAKTVGARVLVVDAGVASPLPESDGLRTLNMGPGTSNMARGPAMSRAQALGCVEAGVEMALDLASQGMHLLATGDMGIGNTTAASAITACVTGATPEEVVGPGTGVDARGVEQKAAVVGRALRVNRPDAEDMLDVLSKVGGFEIGFLAGLVLGGAQGRRPVVLDGFISGAAALLACGLQPLARDYVIASHRSTEPGHAIQLAHLGLKPLLDLDLRLGEGTGAALAMPIIQGAARCLRGMATFSGAGVLEKTL